MIVHGFILCDRYYEQYNRKKLASYKNELFHVVYYLILKSKKSKIYLCKHFTKN